MWALVPRTALIQALNLLDAVELVALGHNSVDYVHVVVEALKLAFADRERWYCDPLFVDVPIERLISAEYARARHALIRPCKAWPRSSLEVISRRGVDEQVS